MTKSFNYIFVGLLIIFSFTCSKFKKTNLKLVSTSVSDQHHPTNQMFTTISTVVPIGTLKTNQLAFPQTSYEFRSANKLDRKEGDKIELSNSDNLLIEKENNNEVRDVYKNLNQMNIDTQDNLLADKDEDEDEDDSQLDETE